MPNWVKNKIIVGNKRTIEELIDKYCVSEHTEEGNRYNFDFNKVIKMPKELEIEFSTKSDNALSMYMTYINPNVDYFGDPKDKISSKEWKKLNDMLGKHMVVNKNFSLGEEAINTLNEKYEDELEDLLALGKQEVSNLQKYNAVNWYEWSINNWGTKWNSSAFDIGDDGKSLTFETAWDPAIPVFMEITRQNPNYKFVMLYADEEIGCHTGYILAKDGIIDYKGGFREFSTDAYKLAMDLWDCGDSYKYDAEKDTYVTIEEYKEKSFDMSI